MELSDLSAAEQNAIYALPCRLETFRQRYAVTRPSDTLSNVTVVTAGMLGRYSVSERGRRHFTAFYGQGDIAGLGAASGAVEIGNLVALSDALVIQMPASAVSGIVQRYPSLGTAFWRELAYEHAILTQWAVNVGRLSARAKIAHILCEMAIRSGTCLKPSIKYTLKITQTQLGDAIGITGVHTNRLLKDLRELVTFVAGEVAIHDWQGLAKIAKFFPKYLDRRVAARPARD